MIATSFTSYASEKRTGAQLKPAVSRGKRWRSKAARRVAVVFTKIEKVSLFPRPSPHRETRAPLFRSPRFSSIPDMIHRFRGWREAGNQNNADLEGGVGKGDPSEKAGPCFVDVRGKKKKKQRQHVSFFRSITLFSHLLLGFFPFFPSNSKLLTAPPPSLSRRRP